MTKASIRAASRLLRQSIAVRSWPLWSVQPRWLVAFVLAVIATDLTALGVMASSTAITRSDLALFCSNCHRMIHRKPPWSTPGQLRDLIETGSGSTRVDSV